MRLTSKARESVTVECSRCGTPYPPELVDHRCPVCDTPSDPSGATAEAGRWARYAEDSTLLVVAATTMNVLLLVIVLIILRHHI